MRVHRCPICKISFRYDPDPLLEHFPFCSNRCQSVDLGHWFREDYRVSRPLNNEDSKDDAGGDESSQF